jgi:hypothetical protein
MYEERFSEPHKQGLERFNNGDNAGRFFTNERIEQVTDEEGNTRNEYVYDVYEVADCRDPHKVKNEVIESEHPFGDETKILRKTLAKMLKASGQYDSEDYAEFKAYNEFAESI